MVWFRVLTATLAVIVSAGWLWLASHVSDGPAVLGRYSRGYAVLLAALGLIVILLWLAQWGPIFRRVSRVRTEITLTLGAILVGGVLLEGAVRAFDPLGVSYYHEIWRHEVEKVPDPALFYKQSPGLVRTYQGVDVRFNELGLRDRPLVARAQDEYRILVLGDSVAFGWGVAQEKTFARRLEGLLSGAQRRVTTVNSGVPSYNTVQQQRFLEQHAARIDPNMVLLTYVMNDTDIYEGVFDPWTQWRLAGRTPPEQLTIVASYSWLYRIGDFLTRVSRRPANANRMPDPRGLAESKQALAALADFCSARGIPFVVFVYRVRSGWMASPQHDETLTREVASVGEAKRFPVVDVASWWSDGDRGRMFNSVIDGHPNAYAHGVLADGMARWLRQHAGSIGLDGIDRDDARAGIANRGEGR